MTQYSLTVTLAADLSQVTGTAAIRYTNREDVALGEVYLHLYPNLWDGGMTVWGVQVAGRPVSATLESDDDLLRVPLETPLEPGQAVELAMSFAVPVPKDGNVGNYGEFAYLDGLLAMAHFYPTVAVYDSPGGWHLETPALQGDVLYHDASVYDVALTAPADLIVAATGSTLSMADNGDGTVTWRLAGGPMRDFNIAASAGYVLVSQEAGDVVINSYALAQDAAAARQALAWAVRSFETYQTAFGPYPYRELDVVQTATSAGGIEYPGLIAVAKRLYSDPAQAPFFESVVVHEVAHQWWYNVVGNDQVNHPWLDEALTQYATFLYFRDVYGLEGAENFIRTMNARWSRADFGEIPIGLPVGAYDSREYGAIVYGRGPLFFLALRDRIGEAKMAELLRRYYAGYAWRIATPDSFRSLAEEVAGQDLGDLFKKWVNP